MWVQLTVPVWVSLWAMLWAMLWASLWAMQKDSLLVMHSDCSSVLLLASE